MHIPLYDSQTLRHLLIARSAARRSTTARHGFSGGAVALPGLLPSRGQQGLNDCPEQVALEMGLEVERYV